MTDDEKRALGVLVDGQKKYGFGNIEATARAGIGAIEEKTSSRTNSKTNQKK